MEPALELESQILALQQPMNDVIDRGDSSVQQFYKDTTVFVTGASGFIGKQLLQKLFRSCQIKKMYVLLRPKHGKPIQERLNTILKDPVYDGLRKVKPRFADQITPVEGDVAEIRLGLSDKDWNKLSEEVNVIFHVAATVNFDEPLKKATLINVRGTREALALARSCKKFKCFTHVSTAFCHATKNRISTDIEEKFYPCAVPPEAMIGLVENLDEKKLQAMTAELISDWPNTYTFTKAIAEDIIRKTKDVPVCVVRPPVVTSSYVEPGPGWIDTRTCLASPLGALLGIGLGVLHVLYICIDSVTCYAPVDYVNNAIITAGWDFTERRKKGYRENTVYTVSTSAVGITWRYFNKVLRSKECRNLSTTKAVWYIDCMHTGNRYVFWLLMWVFQFIPAYVIDGILDLFGARPKGVPRLLPMFKRAYKIGLVYEYFVFNSWNIKDDNCQAMYRRLSPADKAIYACDTRSIDFSLLVIAWCVGLRRYIIRDNLDRFQTAQMRQKIFKYVRLFVVPLYLYVLYYIIHTLFNILISVVMFVF